MTFAEVAVKHISPSSSGGFQWNIYADDFLVVDV